MSGNPKPDNMPRQWAMFMHFSILANFVVPFGGVVLPIIAGIKANNGEVWKYPLTLQIIK